MVRQRDSLILMRDTVLDIADERTGSQLGTGTRQLPVCYDVDAVVYM